MKVVWHFLLIIIAVGAAFLVSQTGAADYTIQILAGLIIIYLITAFIRKKVNPQMQLFGNGIDIVVLIIAILLLISITGNIYSPLFFLIYFLGFGITFIFEPFSVIIFTVSALLYFLPIALINGSIESFIRIGSILLIAPLAFFFGEDLKEKEYVEEKLEENKEREADTGETITKDIKEVLEKDKDLKPEEVDKLDEILEEADDLRSEKNQE